MSLLTTDEARAFGVELREAEKARRQIALISARRPDIGLPEAYAIQAAFVERKRQDGATPKGWKIGLTSRAMQSALGIDIPDSGVLFDDMFFESGGTIPADRFIEPRIEAEIAFVMRADLAGPGVGVVDVLRATEFVAPALEILDTRILRRDTASGRNRTIVDTVSDNAANAGIVLGTRLLRPAEVDLRWVGAIVSRDGVVEETGLGAGVLDNPLRGIAWLANRLASVGQSIRAGEVLLSGSFIRPIESPHGATITADFGPFGSVGCHFA
ncbi:MAG: 2-oxo-hept-4-ene-1,7-dioate hydratase [Lautropia sp.]